eukprot:3704093-Pleurochrysis_carterae.AAC.1
MVAIADLGERNQLATTIPGSHLRVFKVSPIVFEMLLRGSSDVLRGSPATLRGSPVALRGSPAVRRGSPDRARGSPNAGGGSAGEARPRLRAWLARASPANIMNKLYSQLQRQVLPELLLNIWRGARFSGSAPYIKKYSTGNIN